MNHVIIEYKLAPVGDGECEEYWECACGDSVNIVKSNGTLYGERAGEYHGHYPEPKCPLLIEIVEEARS